MLTYLEAAYERINNLIDYMGYLLMLTLSILLWWGIYSGVEITVAETQALVQSTAANQTDPVRSASSIPTRIAPPSVAVDHDLDNARSLASGL